MKERTAVKVLSTVVVGTALSASAAWALPIDFSGPDGTVETEVLWSWGCGVDIASDLLVDDGLAYNGVALTDTTLDVGESLTFDFFELEVSGWGIGEYSVEASLSFDTPSFGTDTSSGGGYFFSLGGYVSGGTLAWNSQPGLFQVGDDWLEVSFEEGMALGLGNSQIVHATITNHGSDAAPVPEPATMVLFGTGLACLAGLGRKKVK